MIHRDKTVIDFGMWQQFSSSDLICPLYVHVGNFARSLQLLERKIDDREAVSEISHDLRLSDAKDPINYNFALFSIGIFVGWKSNTR